VTGRGAHGASDIGAAEVPIVEPAGSPAAPVPTDMSGERRASHPSQLLRLAMRPVAIYFASRAGVLLVVGAVAAVLKVSVAHVLIGWDSRWYLLIARDGYASSIPPGTGNPAQSDLGFFPLTALVVRAVHLVPGLTWTSAGLVSAFLIGMMASVALWFLLRDVAGVRGADRGTALVLLSPGAFVLSYVYSEGIVILFVSLCLMSLRRRWWLAAGLAAAIATSADPVAIAVVAPCIVACYDAVRARGEWRSLLAPVLAPLGVVGFFSYLWAHTGSFFEWFHAQRRGWQSGYYFTGVPKAFAGVFTTGFDNLNPVIKAASFIVAIALVVLFVRWRPPRTWAAYVFAVLGLGVLSPIVGVTPRILLRDAPLIGFVGAKMPERYFAWALAGSAMLCGALIVVSSTSRFTP
jgi:hypothetical protein